MPEGLPSAAVVACGGIIFTILSDFFSKIERLFLRAGEEQQDVWETRLYKGQLRN